VRLKCSIDRDHFGYLRIRRAGLRVLPEWVSMQSGHCVVNATGERHQCFEPGKDRFVGY
jgi:hypothetical protein